MQVKGGASIAEIRTLRNILALLLTQQAQEHSILEAQLSIKTNEDLAQLEKDEPAVRKADQDAR